MNTSSQPLDREQIAKLAYELWEQRGSPVGSPEVDWSAAEAQLNNACADGHLQDTPNTSARQNSRPHRSEDEKLKPDTVRTDELFNDEDTPVPLTPELADFH